MKRGPLLLLVGTYLLLGAGLGWADQSDEKERTELASALKGATVSLKQGMVASESKGKPISGKFEVTDEDGTLHLSVYTTKGGAFSEVLVDPKTGQVLEAEAIEDGEDLTAAKAQDGAMEKAKTSLAGALDTAVKKNGGFQPVSVTPTLKDGHPIANVTLMKGGEATTVSEKLE